MYWYDNPDSASLSVNDIQISAKGTLSSRVLSYQENSNV